MPFQPPSTLVSGTGPPLCWIFGGFFWWLVFCFMGSAIYSLLILFLWMHTDLQYSRKIFVPMELLANYHFVTPPSTYLSLLILMSPPSIILQKVANQFLPIFCNASLHTTPFQENQVLPGWNTGLLPPYTDYFQNAHWGHPDDWESDYYPFQLTLPQKRRKFYLLQWYPLVILSNVFVRMYCPVTKAILLALIHSGIF